MTESLNKPETLALTNWLCHMRKSQGLSMRVLAERLGGKPHTYVQKVESGERRLDTVEYVWYCRALGVNPEEGIAVIVANLTPME
jgi:transcriptional regulator with XRE-family HTH domain